MNVLVAVLTAIASQAASDAPHPATGSVLWRGDFETNDFSQWRGHGQAAERSRITIVTSVEGKPVRQGKYAARFEVQSGDSHVAGSGEGGRAELLLTSATTQGAEGHEQYWAWSTYFPSDFASAGGRWNYFTQFHHSGSTGQVPIAFVVAQKTQLELVCNNGTDPKKPKQRRFALAPLRRGNWYDFIFHVKWSTDESVGFVEVWVDGKPVVPKTMIATLYPGMSVYLKQGFYRAKAKVDTVIYHDGMRVGSTRESVEHN